MKTATILCALFCAVAPVPSTPVRQLPFPCLFFYLSLSPALRAVDRPVRLRAFPQDPRRLRSLDQLHVLRGYGGELRRPKLSRFHHDRRSGGLASHWFLHLAEHGGLLQLWPAPESLVPCSKTATWSDASWTAMVWWKPLTHTTR